MKVPASVRSFRPRGRQSLRIAVLLLAVLSTATVNHAGDILRGGATAAARRSNANARATAGAAEADAAKTRAQDRLARTTQAITAVRNMQRGAATALVVPDGLVPGGLQRATGPNARWDGAQAPIQNGGTVTIKQTESQAVLHWETFNVGRNTTLNFDQSAGKTDAGKWIAFNKVFDPSGVPSKILGSIKADGQVYILNQNGIIFGAGSQVNVRTLVASSLPVNDNLIESGLLNNRDAQFLFSALEVPGGSDGTPAFIPPPPPPGGRYGDVHVQPGAEIQSPVSADGNGGRVMLVGANVRNDGVISTPSGQTILAAGLQVGVRAHPQDDPSLRGLDAWVGSVGNYAGTVTNAGLIEAMTGSVLVTGREINQLGVIDSSTSVNLNGRIDLLASYGAVSNPNFDSFAGSNQPPFLSQWTGSVNLGPGSTTRILPDLLSSKKIPGSRLAERSQIFIEGLNVLFGRDAIMLAPSADISIRAGTWPFKDTDGDRTSLDATGNNQAGLAQQINGGAQRFLFSAGNVHFEAGSLVDASGSTEAFVSLAQHLIAVQLRGFELADSPLLRNSNLRGLSLIVDLRRSGLYGGREWVGTPLGDLTGFAAIIERDIAQLTAAGGTITVAAGGSVVVQNGATLDVSGGFLTHEGGRIQTSRLLMGGRHLINVDDAKPNVLYDGVYEGRSVETSNKWGLSKTFAHALAPLGGYHQQQYVEGASGGTINLAAPNIVLAGNLVGQTIKGPRQQESPPVLSTLRLAFRGETQLALGATNFAFVNTSPTPPLVRFVEGSGRGGGPQAPGSSSIFEIGTALYGEEGGGFGNIEIDNADGDFLLSRGTPLSIPAGGSLVVKARNVLIQDQITAPGGTLSFTAYNFSPFLYEELFARGAFQDAPAPAVQPGRGSILIDDNVTISVAGMMADDRPTSPEAIVSGRVLHGGSITFEGYDILLGQGSVVDASGGVWARPTGGFEYGDGGSIAVLSGRDPDLETTIGGSLEMKGSLQAYSAARGGSLTIQANLIQIGGSASREDITVFQPDFFRKGGFSSYSLIGIGARADDGTYLPAVRLTAGTTIEPVTESWVLAPYGRGRGLLTMRPYLKPVGLRPPASLSLTGLGADDPFVPPSGIDVIEALGLVVLEEGSRILTDPGASVELDGEAVAVLGTIEAPGGLIAISGASSFKLPSTLAPAVASALPTVFIGPAARLSTAGTTVLLPDPFGRRSGIIHPGGTISVSGNIVAAAGAVLDVSGASAVLDFHPTRLSVGATPLVPANAGLNTLPWGMRGVPTRVDSDGGLIELHGSQMLYSDATLLGNAGGPAALGGTLSISSGRFYTSGAGRTGADINLIVEQSGNAAAFGNVGRLGNIVELMTGRTNFAPALASDGAAGGIGYFAINQFSRGGFDSLDLGFQYFADASPIPYGGNVEFRGPVDITARGFVRVAGGGVIQANSAVRITAPYVAIGQEFRAPLNPDDAFVPFQEFAPGGGTPQYFFPPTHGAGSLNVAASLIDVGTLSLQGVGSALLAADGGDIRGNGILSIAGDLILRAAQVYPTTLATFDIFAYDPPGGTGSVTILPSGVRPLPLSAGGSLRIFASTITNNGVLRAPLGSIALGWDGVDLDPSDADLDQPFNPVAGASATVPTAQTVTLGAGSITSISAVDPLTGEGLLFPFGLSPDGLTWIDPRGEDITVSGLPSRGVYLSGNSVITEPGSVVDLRGGGDLLAYRWVPGTGGSADILGSAINTWSPGQEYSAGDLVLFGGSTWSARVNLDPDAFGGAPAPSESRYWSKVPESYVVIPGFGSEFAPYNSFNTGPNAGSLAGDPGYVSSSLRLGEQIHLANLPGLADGFYTLLPRRYGVLPGAYLIIPQEGRLVGSAVPTSTEDPTLGSPSFPIGTALQEEGSYFTSAYTANFFNRATQTRSLLSRFEVVPPDVLEARVEYGRYTANTFLAEAAKRLDISDLQMLPADSASLAIHGNLALSLNGSVLSRSTAGGHGSSIDISSFADIFIVGGTGTAPPGATVVLDAGLLGSWGAESLLVGGLRRTTSEGIVVDVRTNALSLNNPGGAFTGPEITLVSRAELTMSAGSSLTSSGRPSQPSSRLLISGDGTLLRVSGDPSAAVSRSGLTGSTLPLLTIGAGSKIAGGGVILDSTYGSAVDASLEIDAVALTMGSGQISLVLTEPAGGLSGSVVDPHLVLVGNLLDQVQDVSILTLQSYRTIDIYGTGSFGTPGLQELNLLAGGNLSSTAIDEKSLRGYDQAGGGVTIVARSILFDNPIGIGGLAAPPGPLMGELTFDTETIRFGSNSFDIAGYQNLDLKGTGGVIATGSGSFSTVGDMRIISPLIGGAQGVSFDIVAAGALDLLHSPGQATVASGLGASLSFQGASLLAASRIDLPSGLIKLQATTGDLTVAGQLSAAGSSRLFYDLTRYADAGQIELISSTGNISLLQGSSVSVAADPEGGNAGTLIVRSPGGVFDIDGTLAGGSGTGGTTGTFVLDAGSIASFDDLTSDLDVAGFLEERTLRVRTGDITVGGAIAVRKFSLSTDAGSITVTGLIDASGETGGTIELIAQNNLTLASTGELRAAGQHFSNAGKGGRITLEAGAAVNGVANTAALLDLQAGSAIDLSVADHVDGDYLTPGSSAFYGQFEGTLHLRAPRLGNDVRVDTIESTITGASSILVEAYRIYQPAGGTMNIALRNTVHADNTAFINAGEGALGIGGMRDRLLGGTGNEGLDPLLVIAPGVEIINLAGDLTLGLANTTGSANTEALSAADWDLSGFRYGSRDAPGVLTLRAEGDLVFNNTLSDGFTPIAQGSAQNFAEALGHSLMWLAPLMSINASLPVNTQSWSFRLTAGADLAASSFQSVLGAEFLAPGKGSLLLGEFFPAPVPNTSVNGAAAGIDSQGQTADTIRISTNTTNRGTRYEVIRTGTGDIEIHTGRDVQLRNAFASIYTAGVGLPDRTRIFQAGDFSLPITVRSTLQHPSQSTLGAVQQNYAAYYAMAGGNLQVAAGNNIGRYAMVNGDLVADISGQLPTNWLYRRGLVDQNTGLFTDIPITGGFGSATDVSASTTWWVDYSNFFQGFGALGGGDIALTAENDIVNADAAIPTNARMAGIDPMLGENIAPSSSNLLEHGGGDLLVRAGNNIDGGNFYVERGLGRLSAGAEITTNIAQSPSRGNLKTSSASALFLDPLTWQAVTLFGGRSSFNVTARSNILLGPVTSAFLLPQGLNNKFWYKSQFQTIGEDAGVSVTSFGGGVTHRLGVTLPGDTIVLPTLVAAYRQAAPASSGSRGYYRPWLRIVETGIDDYRTLATVSLPSLKSTAFAGDVRVVGELNLFPSPAGELEMLASGGIIGLNQSGVTTTSVGGAPVGVTAWASAIINLSDANPAAIPGITSPLGYQQVINSKDTLTVRDSRINALQSITPLFQETGSYTGVFGTTDVQTALHATSPVHADNPNPLRLYAGGTDITGLTLYSAKKVLAHAQRDITDIAFYLQHVSEEDISIVSAGRDVVPFNENSPLRSLARDISKQNLLVDPFKDTVIMDGANQPIATQALAGDIQIGGQGTLEVLAGRNIDLGSGANFTDGTGVGITSIGRSRNPFLPFAGADLVLLAGIKGASGGPALGLTGSTLNFDGSAAEVPGTAGSTPEHLALAILKRLFQTLQEVGANATETGDYEAGYAAISSLFGGRSSGGNLITQARDIRTTSGGSITIAVPGGGITMASDIFGNPLTPPGIVTEYGGEVSILTDGDVDIGQARIFTLRGGDLTIWSSSGDVAAGNAPKTVVTAPPTRVIIDSTSADLQTDLGGLATGGGIGVLASVEGVEPGNVTLLAPEGTVDAGDAGIRATGNITIAAATVLNADNISAGGAAVGVPVAAPVAAPNIAGLTSASTATGAATSSATQVANQARQQPTPEETPSIIAVEVLGYGGGGEEG